MKLVIALTPLLATIAEGNRILEGTLSGASETQPNEILDQRLGSMKTIRDQYSAFGKSWYEPVTRRTQDLDWLLDLIPEAVYGWYFTLKLAACGFGLETVVEDYCAGGYPTISPAPSSFPSMIPTRIALWDQVGGDLEGSTTSTALGSSVSLSADGNLLVVAGTNALFVYERSYTTDNTRSWSQLSDLSNDVTGADIRAVLSLNGQNLAVGDPSSTFADQGEVFLFTNDPDGDAGWIESERVPGSLSGDSFGSMVDITDDGSRIVASAPGNSRKYVRVFDVRTNSYWFLELEGNANYGKSVAISGDGGFLFIGSYRNDPAANELDVNGSVKIIDLETVKSVGTLEGDSSGTTFGHSIAISSDGKILAIGTLSDNYVKVYKSDTDSDVGFTQIGANLTPLEDQTDSLYGSKIALSTTGIRMVVGAPTDDKKSTDNGRTYVYGISLLGDTVNHIGSVFGETANDQAGSQVDVSGNGKSFSTASILNGGGKGHVRIYERYNEALL